MADESSPRDDLAAVERAAWDMLERGAAERDAAFRRATVATLAQDGTPAARSMILRAAERASRTLRFHTDARSRKVLELRRRPRCLAHFHDHAAGVQVRAACTAELHRGDAVAAAAWAGLPAFGRALYRQPVAPGAVLCAPHDAHAGGALSDSEGYANFVVVQLCVLDMDWLDLAAAGHRRARITRSGAHWLAP